MRMRYRKDPVARAISAAGSHVLSLACLLLYGRYISDTLSAVRAIRAEDALGIGVPMTHKRANQHLMTRLLRRKAEVLEIPVQFFPISPERVKRTSVLEGLQSLAALLLGRVRTPLARPTAARVESSTTTPSAGSEKGRTSPVTSR